MSEKQKPSITLKPVKSSQIEAIGYDKDNNTLAIKFKSGGTYHYSGVTQKHFDELNTAKSVGSHFYTQIKAHPDKFPFTKQP